MLVDKPSFCIIAPTAYLDQYATQSNTHLVLAHLVDHDDAYADFYRQRSNNSDFLIMDCSAFELGQSYDPDKLIELGHKCKANVIVLPDYPFEQSQKTIDAAIKWNNKIKDAGFKTMFVPQSRKGDIEDWISGYKWAAENNDIDVIGMSILGIPNMLSHISPLFARVVATQMLQSIGIFCYSKHHHYLGLTTSPNIEIPSLLNMNALNTCDSSNPVWFGVQGLKYNTTLDSFLPVAKRFVPEVDFDKPNTTKQHIHDVIQHNLDITLDIFKNPTNWL